MSELPHLPENLRHAPTTEIRCVMLAQAVEFFAGHMQETIIKSWKLLCEAAGSAKVPVEIEHSDVRQAIEHLNEARILSEKLARLPRALGAISAFSRVVEFFWLSAYERLKKALKAIALRPSAVPDELLDEFQDIDRDFSNICEIAALIVQANGIAHCKFESHHDQFLKKFSVRSRDTEVVKLNDPWLNDKYVDRKEIVKIFRWFGHEIEEEGVKQYLRKKRRPNDTTCFPDHEAEFGGHKKHLYRVRSVVAWFETNKDKLELTFKTDLPKKTINYFCESNESVQPRPKPR